MIVFQRLYALFMATVKRSHPTVDTMPKQSGHFHISILTMYVLQMYTRDRLLIRYCSTNKRNICLIPSIRRLFCEAKHKFGDAQNWELGLFTKQHVVSFRFYLGWKKLFAKTAADITCWLWHLTQGKWWHFPFVLKKLANIIYSIPIWWTHLFAVMKLICCTKLTLIILLFMYSLVLHTTWLLQAFACRAHLSSRITEILSER